MITAEQLRDLAKTAKDNSGDPYAELRLYPLDLFNATDWPDLLVEMKSEFSRVLLDGFCPEGMMYATGFDPFAPMWQDSRDDEEDEESPELPVITEEMIKRAADALSEEIYATDQHRYKVAEAVLRAALAGPSAP